MGRAPPPATRITLTLHLTTIIVLLMFRANSVGQDAGDEYVKAFQKFTESPSAIERIVFKRNYRGSGTNHITFAEARYQDGNYFLNTPVEDPQGPEQGEAKIIRGGSWGFGPRYLRVSTRAMADPSSRGDGVGFRCVVEESP